MQDKQRKAMFARKSMKEIGSEIWESKSDNNIHGKKIMVIVDRLNGNEETWIRVKKEKDPAWIIKDNGIAERDPSVSFGNNGYRRSVWKERKMYEQDNDDLDWTF